MPSTARFTRRCILRVLATSAAPLALRPFCLRAADTSRGELSFLIVTDTHLGYKDQAKAEQLWLKTAAEIDKAPGAFVLHLGDIVDRGREPQYPKYLAGRALIQKPVHEIPGNHDPQALFQKYVRPEVDTAVDHEWLRVLLLNNAHTDSHDGFLTPGQLAWLAAQCDSAAQKQQLIIVVMHVPAHDNKHPDRGWFVKPANGQAEFYALLEKHAARTLAVFHGHMHNGIRGWSDHHGVHEVCFPSALYNLDRKLEAQGAPGYNVPEFRSGFTSVTLRGDTMTLAFHPLGVAEAVTKELKRQPA